MLALRRRRIVVNLVTGHAVTGERALSWPWRLVLVSAHMQAPGGPSVPVDGRVRVPWARVDYVQVVD